MQHQRLKILVLCLFLALTQAACNSSNATGISNSSVTPQNISFIPPPPITSAGFVMLNKSTVDGRFIGSNRLQSLQLRLNPATASQNISTTFRLNRFNSSVAGKLKTYQVTQKGNWSYISSTQNTLSCIFAYESTTNSYGMLQFLSSQQYFSMIMIRSASQISNEPFTPDDAKAGLSARQNCLAAYFKEGLYRLNSSEIVKVPKPAGWSRSSSPETLLFGFANNILYRYPVDSTFLSLYTFPNSSAYEIRITSSRLLVVAANKTLVNGTTIFNQKMYLFRIPRFSRANVSIITQITFTAFHPNAIASSVHPFLASPQLTKIGTIFSSGNNSNSTILLRSIDPSTNLVSDLTFQEPSRFLTTINRVALDAPKFFGDFFFVVSNDSAAPIANTSFVEQAYQFVGNRVIFLRNRVLATNDTLNFINTYIDATNTNPNQLVVLNTYNVTEGLAIQQLNYGNLASVIKILPPTPPPYISFAIPTGAVPLTNPAIPTSPLSWLYVNPGSGTTNITIVQSNPSFPNNVKINTNVFNGSLSVISINSNCLITRDINNKYTITYIPSVNNSNSNSFNSTAPFTHQDITSQLYNITIDNDTKWILSDKCDRFSVNSIVFANPLNQSNFRLIANMSASALSPNLDAAIVGNSIWLLNTNESSFTLTLNISTPFLLNTIIYRHSSRILITSTNNTAAQVKAYLIENTGILTNSFDKTFSPFQSAPKIHVSSKLSKVLVMGPFTPANKTQTQPRFDFFNIAYSNRTFLPLTFPHEKIPDLYNNFILLDDRFIYIRTLSTVNASNSSSSQGYQESVYFISQDVDLLMASSVYLTQTQVDTWKRTTFLPIEDKKMNVLVESQQIVDSVDYVVVNIQKVSGQQASLNSDSSRGITGVLDKSGKIKLCTGGCSDCSSGKCTGCTRGYFFDDATSHCLPCGSNCATCSSWVYPSCTSCLSNSYLTANNTCLRCDTNCATCNGSATTCTSCPPGQLLIAGQCNTTCPKNCITCNGTTCLTCISGFVVANGSCRVCAASCSNCSASNITQCISCAPGLTLVNSACVPCPDKCLTCSSGVCATCIPGFSPNFNGVCVLTCQISCETCAENQPSVCLSCYSGAYLNGSTCVLNTTCNNDFSCTDCGQGLGYYLLSTICVECTLSNCSQCNPISNNQQCSKCFQSYYLDINYLCQPCSSRCLTCLSADACTSCVIGFTLPQLQTEGQCIACKSPCASCLGVATYCLSCVDGFTKSGWKCQSNKYVGFSFILVEAAPADVLNTVDTLTQHLVTACKLDDSSSITFNSITFASTAVNGSSTSSDPISTSIALSSALSKGNLGSYSVGSVSVTAFGVSNSENQQNKINTGLIAGLVVGLTVFIVMLVIMIYVFYKRRQNECNNIALATRGTDQSDPKIKEEDLPDSQKEIS